MVLSGIANHDNMGGLFRNAAAFGVDLVILDGGCCDPLYRKAIRVSAGAALVTPFAAGGEIGALAAMLARRGLRSHCDQPGRAPPPRRGRRPQRARRCCSAPRGPACRRRCWRRSTASGSTWPAASIRSTSRRPAASCCIICERGDRRGAHQCRRDCVASRRARVASGTGRTRIRAMIGGPPARLGQSASMDRRWLPLNALARIRGRGPTGQLHRGRPKPSCLAKRGQPPCHRARGFSRRSPVRSQAAASVPDRGGAAPLAGRRERPMSASTARWRRSCASAASHAARCACSCRRPSRSASPFRSCAISAPSFPT